MNKPLLVLMGGYKNIRMDMSHSSINELKSSVACLLIPLRFGFFLHFKLLGCYTFHFQVVSQILSSPSLKKNCPRVLTYGKSKRKLIKTGFSFQHLEKTSILKDV